VRYVWIGGRRERARGECGFSSLVKLKKHRQKIGCILLRRKKIFFLYIYDVITSPEKEKRSVTHTYRHTHERHRHTQRHTHLCVYVYTHTLACTHAHICTHFMLTHTNSHTHTHLYPLYAYIHPPTYYTDTHTTPPISPPKKTHR
jgi:hypothetical protein